MTLYTTILSKFGVASSSQHASRAKLTEPRVRRLRLTDAASGEEVDEVEWLGGEFVDSFAGISRLPHGVLFREDDLPKVIWRMPLSADLPTPSEEDILNARWGVLTGVLQHGKLQHEHCYDGKVLPMLSEPHQRDIHFALQRDELDDDGNLTRKHYHWHTELLDETPSDEHVTAHKLNLYFIWLNGVPIYHFWLAPDDIKPFPIRSNCGRAVSEDERLTAARVSAILAATQYSSSPQRTPTKQVKISPTVSQRFFHEQEPLSAFSTSSRGETDMETSLALPKPPNRNSLLSSASIRAVRSLSRDDVPTAISTPTRFKSRGRPRKNRRASDESYIADIEDEGITSSEPSPVLHIRKRKRNDDPEAAFRVSQQSPTTESSDVDLPKPKRKRNVTRKSPRVRADAQQPTVQSPLPSPPSTMHDRARSIERRTSKVKELNTNLAYLTQEIASAGLQSKRNSSASQTSGVRDGHTFLDYTLPGNRDTTRAHLLVQIADERKLLEETFAQLPAKLAHPEQEVRYRYTANSPGNKSFVGRAVDVFKARKNYLNKMLDQVQDGVHDDKVNTALIEELVSTVEGHRQLLAELRSEDFAVASVESESSSDVITPTRSGLEAGMALMDVERGASHARLPKRHRERSAAPSPPASTPMARASISTTAGVKGGDTEASAAEDAPRVRRSTRIAKAAKTEVKTKKTGKKSGK